MKGKKGGEEFLLEQASKVREIVKYLEKKNFKLDNEIDLKATGGVALTYKPSICVHKYMSQGYDFDSQFVDDLFDLVKAYKDVVSKNIEFSHENYLKKNHWVIGCGSNGNQWENFKSNSLVAIGWDELGDLSKFKSNRLSRFSRFIKTTFLSKSAISLSKIESTIKVSCLGKLPTIV